MTVLTVPVGWQKRGCVAIAQKKAAIGGVSANWRFVRAAVVRRKSPDDRFEPKAELEISTLVQLVGHGRPQRNCLNLCVARKLDPSQDKREFSV